MSTKPSFFPQLSVDEIPEQLRGFFAKAAEQIGFIPNVFLALANRPERFSAWFNQFRLVTEPTETLTAADREMIAVVVSAINSCSYCLTSHGYELRAALGDPVQADLIAMNWRNAGLDARQEAICRYVEKLTKTPGEVVADDIEPLREVGLSDEDIWDVIEVAAMYAYTNRVSAAMGATPNREYHFGHREPS